MAALLLDTDPKLIEVKDGLGLSPLNLAALHGRTTMVGALLERGASLDSGDRENSRPLHNAAARGHLDTARFLVKKGADVNVRNKTQGMAPIHWAAPRESLAIVEYLLDKGASIDAQDLEGRTPLFIAAENWKTPMVRLLIERGADGGWTALHNAAFGGLHGVSARLLEKGLDVNAATDNGWTPLFAAASRGRPDLCMLFLEAGADVNGQESKYGRKALHWAAIKGETGMVDLLLAEGAAVDEKDGSGRTPLDLAGQYGNKDVADLLLSKGAGPSTRETNFGRCPLLDKELGKEEVVLWYLGHCGWACKTKSSFLIFDYWENGPEPDQPCLANGHIDPEELEGLDVYVFASHEHGDHFDPTIFWWHRVHENVTYVLGWEPPKAPEYVYTAPRTTNKIGGMTVTTIDANDAGVGFLVEVDGLKLYHAGDHAGWAEGTAYTLKKLPARMMVPTHAGDRKHLYGEYAQRAAQQEWKTKVICPENRGDRFFYGGSTVD